MPELRYGYANINFIRNAKELIFSFTVKTPVRNDKRIVGDYQEIELKSTGSYYELVVSIGRNVSLFVSKNIRETLEHKIVKIKPNERYLAIIYSEPVRFIVLDSKGNIVLDVSDEESVTFKYVGVSSETYYYTDGGRAYWFAETVFKPLAVDYGNGFEEPKMETFRKESRNMLKHDKYGSFGHVKVEITENGIISRHESGFVKAEVLEVIDNYARIKVRNLTDKPRYVSLNSGNYGVGTRLKPFEEKVVGIGLHGDEIILWYPRWEKLYWR